MLAGHLQETPKFIKKNVHANDFQGNQPPSLQAALETRVKKFKAHFSKRNTVSEIRDHSSFHTDTDLLLTAFSAVSDTFLFDIFINGDGFKKGHIGEQLFAGAGIITFGSLLYLPSADILAITEAPIKLYGNEILSLMYEAMLILLLVVIFITEVKLGIKPLEGTELSVPNINYGGIRQPYFSTAI